MKHETELPSLAMASFAGFDHLPIIGVAGAGALRPVPVRLPEAPAAAEVRLLKDTAGFFRVSEPTVRGWIDEGCPAVERSSNGVSDKLNLNEAHAWREARKVAAAVRRDSLPGR